ncbi:hypothetical protein EV683_10882 [Crenobacter luteus]|uniref:Uncharacterized protein n=1 Tax=Crenobacter luteus TaxID=1452487 RepID=A0A165FBT9_9NEIS|nr:hypothetical protein [Crenobacter luteus]KZE32744.1 hypothetical protein AVW16_10165 [Crenobacter luteus]TCP12635.1 hypothetical protein EV683_10882 [Crenobacter luteus]
MKNLSWPIVLITLGSLWFLKSTALLPDTATVLALLLAGAGVGLFVLDGLNKGSIVSAPLLIYAGAAVYLNDRYGLRFSHVFSLGMVLAGVLMLLAQSSRIPSRGRRRRLGQPHDSQ